MPSVPRSEHLMTGLQHLFAMRVNIINSRVPARDAVGSLGMAPGSRDPIKSLLAQNPAPAHQRHALNSFNLSQTINILITSQRPGIKAEGAVPPPCHCQRKNCKPFPINCAFEIRLDL